MPAESVPERVGIPTIAREWGRIGLVGFGGPPAHIGLLRKLCTQEHEWLTEHEFEDGIAATNLLPGPASTQLAIFCAWRLRGRVGALIGGVSFILPGLVIILSLAAIFLAPRPPSWLQGAAAGAGAAVAAVALNAALGLLPASWRRAGGSRGARIRWMSYLTVGGAAAATIGPFLVLVILCCGLLETTVRSGFGDTMSRRVMVLLPATVPVAGGLAALAWVAFKVGALSYGGGFVIVPLMQHDAVATYHWMSGTQFLNAVALGQITPGPVVLTVSVVGYAADGLAGGLLAALVAFAPSFAFVIFGAPHFDRIRSSKRMQAFLIGAGATAIGAIAGAALPLGLQIVHLWQVGILGLAALSLLGLRRSTVSVLIGAGILGVVAVLAGASP
jgi:chromate transporter